MRRFQNPFALLWRHRDLVWQFTVRELHVKHRGTQLGHVWALLSPLTMMLLYFFVFGVIMQGRFGVMKNESSYDFALALFMGLCLFHLISETIGIAPVLIATQPNFVKKVVFPLEIIPMAHVASSLYHSLVSLGLLIIAGLFSNAGISWQGLLLLPFLLLPMAMMALGLAWGLASVGVYIRDIAQITPFASMAVLFSSAVFYSPQKAPTILLFNPLLQVIDQARQVILWHASPNWATLGYVYLCAALMLCAGYLLFAMLRPFFAEVL
jgi:lipopolysaccharide transport system permease protein